MSQIFDALQRSEAERNGKDLIGTSQITDLLRRTEHHASAEQRKDVSDSWNNPPAPEPAAPVAEPRRESGPSVATALRTAVAEPTVQDSNEEPMQCEVLRIAPSADCHLVANSDNESLASERSE